MASGKPAHHPIVIVKKVKVHGAQHGGAWKVAYADFVTAMMALFIVLWLLSSSAPVKEAVADYFKNPTGRKTQIGSGFSGAGESMILSKQDLEKLKEKLEQALRQKIPDMQKLKNQISMNVTSEGLRIELLENPNGCFFERGSAQPTPLGIEVISVLAQELGKLPNDILLEGHTDSTPYGPGKSYTNWELSTDRANAARRLMQLQGVRPDQVKAVRGYADQRLRDTKDPADAANRRISVVVAYQPEDLKNVELPTSGKVEAALKATEEPKRPPSPPNGGA